MALKRVTMQDIADACGLSRNTVSKIFNQRGAVPETTRELVLKTAHELGYFQLPAADKPSSVPSVAPSQAIAVLSYNNPLNHSFGSFFIKAFSDQICRSGYTVKLYEISAEELREGKLPPYISMENTAGILCIELFDRDFLKIVCDFGLPTLIVDGFCNDSRAIWDCDFISMENVASSIRLTEHLIAQGARRIGFVGDRLHCNSFYERWEGFRYSLSQAGLPFDPEICILDKNEEPYGDIDWIAKKVNHMPYIPDAFFCLNDFHAIHMMNVLKRRGLRIPDDVMITGFDNSPESRVIDPGITTANIPSTDLGVQAAEILSSRIANPERSYSFTYVKTAPIYRGSTKRNNK